MAIFRGLTHQIARLLILAFCVSLVVMISLSFIPQPALARTSHIAQDLGDFGGGLESKPDQWGAPDRQLFPTVYHTGVRVGPAASLSQAVLSFITQLLLRWI